MLRGKATSSSLSIFFLRPIKLIPADVKKADGYMGLKLNRKFLAVVQGLVVIHVQDMDEII